MIEVFFIHDIWNKYCGECDKDNMNFNFLEVNEIYKFENKIW
jgi:hypothetical protein